MGLCGAKKAPAAGEPSAACERPRPPPPELEAKALLGGPPSSQNSPEGEAATRPHDPPAEPEPLQTLPEKRSRPPQTWSAVAKESSLWRARLIMDNRGSVDDYYSVDRQKLGQGSYGYVCKGLSRETGATRAVKYLSKARAKGLRMRFRQEIEIMKRVDHPNIIKLVETFEDSDHIFLVMELCVGGDLYNRLAQHGPFAEGSAALLMQQIFRPVCYMHGQGICHRDLKLENFLLLTEEPVEQNTLKLIDFGFSCPTEPGQMLSTKLGTPRYSSPQVLAGSYDRSCDLWSCGVIMYMLLSGDAPFDGRSDAEVMQCVRRGNYRFAAPLWRGASEDSKALVRMLLKYRPEERCDAAAALAHCWIRERTPEPSSGAGPRPSIIADLRSFCRQNRLRQAALQIVAQQLPEEETKAFRRSFAALDMRGSGVLAVSELADCLQEDGLSSTPEELRQAVKELAGGDSVAVVGYTDFLAATLDARRHLDQGACLAAFRAFDRNGDGRISRDELEELLKSGTGEVDDATAADISDLLEEVDANRDGAIDFQEFKDMLTGHQLTVL